MSETLRMFNKGDKLTLTEDFEIADDKGLQHYSRVIFEGEIKANEVYLETSGTTEGDVDIRVTLIIYRLNRRKWQDKMIRKHRKDSAR